MSVTLAKLATIGRVVVATGNPVARRSGTDVSVDASQLAHLPTGASLPSILAQLPSAAMGSNGQVHVNGDHNGLNYYIDGVQVPSNLNRVLGTEVDPADIGYLDVLEGAYPAQYGDKFAAVLNIGTKAYAGPPGFDLSAEGGSFGTFQGSFSAHAPIGARGGSISFASFLGRNDWGLDPPVTDPVHNDSSDANQFLRVSLPVAANDTLNFDAIHSLQTFQIPPDTASGVPAATDDDEFQNDTFVALQYRHDIGGHGSLQFGPSLKVSNILDTNDLTNDLAAGGPPPPPGQINCIDFTDCVFSVYANRTARDYRFNVDYTLKSAHHTIRAGALYDAASILKDYVITLQPFSAKNPAGTFTATDTSPNAGHQQEAYLQDSWSMGNAYLLDYGLRMDAFQIFSTNFDQGYAQWSPRIKLTRFFGPRTSVYAYYGRLFVPFSFENVNPVTAAALYYAPPPQTFDLRPQRDSLYELGAHIPLGPADLGIRIMHKVSTDWIDDTQVGATQPASRHQLPSRPRRRAVTLRSAEPPTRRPRVRIGNAQHRAQQFDLRNEPAAKLHARAATRTVRGTPHAVLRATRRRSRASRSRPALGRQRRLARLRHPRRLVLHQRRIRQRPLLRRSKRHRPRPPTLRLRRRHGMLHQRRGQLQSPAAPALQHRERRKHRTTPHRIALDPQRLPRPLRHHARQFTTRARTTLAPVRFCCSSTSCHPERSERSERSRRAAEKLNPRSGPSTTALRAYAQGDRVKKAPPV